MRQRQIARQRDRPLTQLFAFLLLLLLQLACLIKLVLGPPQFSAKSFVGRSKLPVFLGQFLSTNSLRVATAKEIPGGFVPG